MEMTISNARLSWRHIWIVSIASLGQLLGTLVATVVSVIIPMIQIVGRPELASWEQGLLGAVDLIGIAVGATILGKLSNRYGYLLFFRICPAIVCVAGALCVIFPAVWVSFIGLFIIGFAIGGEYSLDSDYVSELMPSKWRATMVGVTKAASALGNILVAGIAYLLIVHWDTATAWPKLLWMISITGGVMFLSRIYFGSSPKWLLEHGKRAEAEKAVKFFLGPDVELDPPSQDSNNAKESAKTPDLSLGKFIKENIRKVILTGIPWACEGLGVYGIGIFLPMLVMALGIAPEPLHQTAIMHVAFSVKLTFWISCLILPGFIVGLWIIKRTRHTSQLAWGFYLSAVSMVLLLLAYHFKWPAWISIVAFMAFELFLNMGPHLITYVLPPEVYPVSTRSLGSGLAATLGKVGALLAVFFIPVLLKAGGITLVLIVSAAIMAIGGAVTNLYASAATGNSDN